jgi:hypothetical protein
MANGDDNTQSILPGDQLAASIQGIAQNMQAVGTLQTPGIQPAPPAITTMAQGGETLWGTTALVGEKGPEIVKLPPGAKVIPAKGEVPTRAFQAGGTVGLNPELAAIFSSTPAPTVGIGAGAGGAATGGLTLSTGAILANPVPDTTADTSGYDVSGLDDQNKSTPVDELHPGHQVYAPKPPDYLGLNDSGLNTVERILHSIYKPDDSTVTHTPAAQPAAAPTQPETDNSTALDQSSFHSQDYYDTRDYLRHGEDFMFQNLEGHDSVIGNGTTFGLDYGSGGNDAEDNGRGAFGANTRDPTLAGAALPISVLKNSIGDYENDPAIFQAIKRGDYKVMVENENGDSTVVPIVDAGPADWTGNAIDLTYKTSHDLGTQGKAKIGYQIIGPDGSIIPIKGYHHDTVAPANYEDHIGPNRKKAQQPSEEEQETEPEQKPVSTPGREEKPATSAPKSAPAPAISGTEGTTGQEEKKESTVKPTRNRIAEFFKAHKIPFSAAKAVYNDAEQQVEIPQEDGSTNLYPYSQF